MPTFTFGGPFSTKTGVSGTSTAFYTESGVTFTFSVQNGDGDNYIDLGGGNVFADVGFGGKLTSQDVFILDVTGAGQTQFDDTILFTVTGLSGVWTVNGQALATGQNTLTGPQGSLVFTNSSGGNYDSFSITQLSATINCFLTGTAIATPTGPRAVEDLRPGDRICLADGGTTAVRWVGRQDMTPRLEQPAKINPIRIAAGALAEGVPARDLYLTRDHAVGIDGYLIDAGALVNGTTIRQVATMPMDGFSYYHVETEAHELILAEGCPSESFVDHVGRDAFVNGAERADAPPIPDMDQLRISSLRLLPESIRSRIAARAAGPRAILKAA